MHHLTGLILLPLCRLTSGTCVQRILVRIITTVSRACDILFVFSAPFTKRTHTCGALNAAHVGEHVVLAGWLLPER